MALTALALVAVSMVVEMHVRIVDVSRSHVEEAQLARTVLTKMASDLRNVVRHDPLKMAELAKSATSGAAVGGTGGGGTGGGGTGGGGTGGGGTGGGGTGGGGTGGGGTGGGGTGGGGTGGGGTGGGGTGGGGTGGGGTGGGTSDLSGEAPVLVDSTCPQTIPGLYGTANAIQVDMSRLPGVHQFASQTAMAGDPSGASQLSDTKTVTYFVIPREAGATPGLTQPGTGLVRREMSRATASFSANLGFSDPGDSAVEVLAPEVVGVEFQYFDGSEIWDYWSTEERQALPTAIKMTLYIAPRRQLESGASAWSGTASGASSQDQGVLAYTLIVHIPGSELGSSAGSMTSEQIATGETGSEPDAVGGGGKGGGGGGGGKDGGGGGASGKGGSGKGGSGKGGSGKGGSGKGASGKGGSGKGGSGKGGSGGGGSGKGRSGGGGGGGGGATKR